MILKDVIKKFALREYGYDWNKGEVEIYLPNGKYYDNFKEFIGYRHGRLGTLQSPTALLYNKELCKKECIVCKTGIQNEDLKIFILG